MNLREKYERLMEVIREVQHLEYAANLLHWDLETYMPPKGANGRAKVMATVSSKAFQMFTSDEVGALLEDLSQPENLEKLEEHERAIVKVCYRDYQRKKAIPPKLYHELQETSAKAQVAWREAREKSDYEIFKPHLEKVLNLTRQVADHIGYSKERYDALLEDYEPGFTAEDFSRIAKPLKEGLRKIIEATQRGEEPSTEVLKGDFPEELQRKLLNRSLEYIGLDTSFFRMDKSAHPFTITIGPEDVRITVRYNPKSFIESLMAGLHEGGHALYEIGIDPRYKETPLGTGASYGMHESQSRFWENAIGRSKAFWKFIWSDLSQIFGGLIKGSPEDFYRAVNVVKPSLIRVEADEVTYNLHILLRFELEREMINNPDFDLDSLPQLWNDKMREYLGLTPPNDAKGVLQDIHWSFGAFGYFPTYTLGNLYSAQLYYALKRENPDLFQGSLSSEKLREILKWMRDKVHQYGRSALPMDILRRATGEPLNPNYLLQYLSEKVSEVYQVSVDNAVIA